MFFDDQLRLFSIQMFQNLQREREREEQKLEAGKVALEQHQGRLEEELTDQKSKLKQLLTDVSAAEERLRTLQEEERCTESLEKMLSQASKFTAGIKWWRWGGGCTGCLVKYVKKTQPQPPKEETGEPKWEGRPRMQGRRANVSLW